MHLRITLAIVLVLTMAVGVLIIDAAHAGAEPRDHRGQCFDLMELHQGTAEPTRQHWFNHLDARGYARYWIACVEGWGTAEWHCLERLWDGESWWRHDVRGGIPQAMPASKLLRTDQGGGPDGYTNPRTQIRWGATYIADRYGRPTNAGTTPPFSRESCDAGY